MLNQPWLDVVFSRVGRHNQAVVGGRAEVLAKVSEV